MEYYSAMRKKEVCHEGYYVKRKTNTVLSHLYVESKGKKSEIHRTVDTTGSGAFDSHMDGCDELESRRAPKSLTVMEMQSITTVR